MPTSHESRVMASQNQMTFVSRIKLNSSRHTRVSTSKIARMFIHVKRHWMAQTYYMSSFQMNLLDLENYHSTVAISSITYQRSKHRTYDPFKCHSTACVCVCLQSTTECIPFTQLHSDTEQMIAWRMFVCVRLCYCWHSFIKTLPCTTESGRLLSFGRVPRATFASPFVYTYITHWRRTHMLRSRHATRCVCGNDMRSRQSYTQNNRQCYFGSQPSLAAPVSIRQAAVAIIRVHSTHSNTHIQHMHIVRIAHQVYM